MNKKILGLFLFTLILSGCGLGPKEDLESSVKTEEVVVEAEEKVEEEEKEEEVVLDPKDQIDLSLLPNEAGKVMVLMYHNIGPEEKEWVRTPDNFKKDLLTLYEKGYRPIALKDYVSGNIDTQAGYTPIVITFDDGNKNNFEYLEDGSINKDSAISILLDFNKEYPDFLPRVTFFLNGDIPFGQGGLEGKKLDFILENGMDVGNHTRSHANFKDLAKEDLEKEIGGQANHLEGLISNKDYRVNTIALPFGSRPKDDSLSTYLREGSYDSKDYFNIAILNVGWNPGFSPYDGRFNFESIPRIRASEMKVDNVGMYNYLEYFDNNPGERFISDGFSEVITVPEEKLENIKTNPEKEIYVYKIEEVVN